MKKILKRSLRAVFVVLVIINLYIIISGNTFLYKAIWMGPFHGSWGPTIDEHEGFYNRIVEAGTHIPWQTAVNYNQVKLSAEHLKSVEKYESVAFLVIQNKKILLEKYWEDFGQDSYINSFSMAKSILGLLTGVAIKEGKIESVDQLVEDFLPRFKGTGLTIEHLLTMSTGINFDENYTNPVGYPSRAYYDYDLAELNKNYTVTGTPGKVFEYRSGVSQILANTLKKATGKNVSEYASEKLWKPLGAKNPAMWSLDDEGGDEKAFCCFNSNARDFARIGQMMLDHGKWNGKRVIPRNYVEMSITPANILEQDGSPNKRYGYQWWIANYKEMDVFYARGLKGQYIIYIPEKELVIVRLGRKRSKIQIDGHRVEIFEFIDAALSIFS